MNTNKVRINILVSLSDQEDLLSLVGQEFVFGRHPTSNVFLNDPSFSRAHFKIFSDNMSIWILDLGSSNGTYLNGERLDSETPVILGENDSINILNSNTEIKIQNIEFISSEFTDQNENENEYEEENEEENDDENGIESEDFDLSALSQQIIEAANLKVEQILEDASAKSEALIRAANIEIEKNRTAAIKASEKTVLEKVMKAEFELTQYANDSRSRVDAEIETSKDSLLIEMKKQVQDERNQILKKLEEDRLFVIKENEKKKNDILANLKKFEQQLISKKEEYSKLDTLFEQKLQKTNAELDLKVESKRNELAKMQTSLEEEQRLHAEQIEIALRSKQIELTQLEAVFNEENAKRLREVEQTVLERKQELQFNLNEIEKNITGKKQEITKLEIAFENQKNNQFQILEAQTENKRFELTEQLANYESKIESTQKEFSNLFEHYETKKSEQVTILENLTKQKSQIQAEIKDLSQRLLETKTQVEDQFQKDKILLDSAHNELEKFKKIKNELENNCLKLSNELALVQNNLIEAKKITLEEELLVKQKRTSLASHEAEIKKMISQKEMMVPKIASLTNELNDLNKKLQLAAQATSSIQAEHAKDVAALKNKFLQDKTFLENEMRKLKEVEEKRLQDLTRQELNQINKIKEDSLRLVLDLENSITKEISNSTSKVFANTIGIAKFREIAPEFEKSIRSSLQAGVLKLLQNELTPADPNKSKSLSSNQKMWKPMSLGMVVSAIIFGLFPYFYRQVQDQNDPIKQQLEAQARAAAVVPIKKFTPQKVSTLGSSFVNSVIYTEEFCEIYSQENFRSELMKKGSTYLYKQWQIEEEKSIQSYAIIFSLIDTLRAKTEKIDPEFEKRDIAKMAIIEKETMKKLEKILGNEVRLEAALKFQTRYYQEYLAQRGIASGNKESKDSPNNN